MIRDENHSKIWLTGYMGSGKTTVGRLLAERLDGCFTDSDAWIEQQSGKSVAELFEQDGEPAFREWERRFVEALPPGKTIVACGGGLPCSHNLIEILLQKGTVIFLKASVKTLAERLRNETQLRPLLKGLSSEALEAAIAQRLAMRKPVYEKADLIVDTDGKTARAIAEELVELLSA